MTHGDSENFITGPICLMAPAFGCSISASIPLWRTWGSEKISSRAYTGAQGKPTALSASSHSSLGFCLNSSSRKGTSASLFSTRFSAFAYLGSSLTSSPRPIPWQRRPQRRSLPAAMRRPFPSPASKAW